MPIISISLTRKILEDLEKIIEYRGYFNRSEAIRDAIRNIIMEHRLSLQEDEEVFTTIIIAYDINREDIDARFSRLRHEYNEIIIENIHRHVQNLYCIELFIVQGKNSQVVELIGRIRGIRGINQIKYIILPLEVG